MKKYILLFLFSALFIQVNAQMPFNLESENVEAYKKYIQTVNQGASSTNSNMQNAEDVSRKGISGHSLADSSNAQYNQDIEGYKAFQKWNDLQNRKTTLQIFGNELFANKKLSFEPNLNLPTPPNYILGAEDELIIDVSGLFDAHYRAKVSPEGSIRIPAVGLVKVGGQTIQAASSAIRNRFSKIYTGLSSGDTQINISLGNIRSIRVTIIGEATIPGTYTIPSLATAFNALYACGGPGKNGSMRDIKIYRNGKEMASIDMYSFLVDGKNSNNITLQEGDIIKVEPYKKRVTITGEVKHEAIFEAKDNETLHDLVQFAGGFTENASQKIVTAIRVTQDGKTVIDITPNQLSKHELQSGDNYYVTTIYEKFDNKVEIHGSINRPGTYALVPGMTVKDLIVKADSVTKNAYLDFASIHRKRENMKPEVLSFNLRRILKNEIPDIYLMNNDSLFINSVSDFKKEERVSIWGEVNVPGEYKLDEKITVRDLIFRAKGFTTKAFIDTIELIRIVTDPLKLSTTNIKTVVIKVPVEKDFTIVDNPQYDLKDGDQVLVRVLTGYEDVRMVKIDGEVTRPGDYNILTKTEKVSDLIKRAGGLTKFAYAEGAYLIRSEKIGAVEAIIRQQMVDNAKKHLENSKIKNLEEQYNNDERTATGFNLLEELKVTEGIVGIDLKDILVKKNSTKDLILEDGDVLYIPKKLQTVRVIGEVLFPTYVSYQKGMNLKDYVGNAGGFSDRASKRKTFVLYANGSAKTTKSFLGFKSYPPVLPGSHIIVPEKPIDVKNKVSTTELISIMSSIATVAVMIVSVFK